MPRRTIIFIGLSSLLVLFLSACVSTLPVTFPPTPTSLPPDTPPSEVGITETISETTDTPLPTASAESTLEESPVSPQPTSTPVPLPDFITARDQALNYVEQGYQLSLPEPASFDETDPAQIAVTGLTAMVAYESGNWRVIVGRSDLSAPGMVDVVIDNVKTRARWWGQVDREGYVVTVVAAGLPRPHSKRVDGWKGEVVSLPPESPYDDYFIGAKGNRHGITSNKKEVQAILLRLRDYEGNVQVWGELHYAVPDYNGRHIIVDRIKLLDGPLPESSQDTEAASTPTSQGEDTNFGPTGALYEPKPGETLVDQVRVSGEAEGIFENQIVVQVESATGEVWGSAPALINAPDVGQKGTFSVDVPFQNPLSATEGRVALYSEEARDGSLILLAWVNIRFAGSASDKSASIILPEAGKRIKGSVRISGTAVGVHNRKVLVRVEDMTGIVWGKATVQTDVPGNWSLKLSVRKPTTVRSGRIAVYDVDPDSGQRVLLAEREVILAR
ncbi:MAG: hypothetical protein GXP38_04270 [Chloroflexi bacterium]|nr:hypothetical protein [Chloroflexota bacterium]